MRTKTHRTYHEVIDAETLYCRIFDDCSSIGSRSPDEWMSKILDLPLIDGFLSSDRVQGRWMVNYNTISRKLDSDATIYRVDDSEPLTDGVVVEWT